MEIIQPAYLAAWHRRVSVLAEARLRLSCAHTAPTPYALRPPSVIFSAMSQKRFLNAIGRKGDGQPVFGTGTSIACVELMHETGAYFPQAHLDPEQMADLAIAGYSVLGMDVVMPLFSVCHEVAAIGCNVNWGTSEQMPESGSPIFRSAEDIVIPPDLLHRPGCRVPLEAIGLLKKRLSGAAAVCGKVFGPWTLAYHLFGVENFLMGTIDSSSATREILSRLLPVTLAFAKAQLDAGADCLLLADHATRDLCSPDAYGQFLKPMHTHLVQEIKGPMILHICGSTADRVAMIAQTGLAGFHWDTKSGPPERFRAWAGDRMSLMGGVNNLLLLNGRPDEVTAQARRAAAAGIDIVGPECAIPLKTPVANLQAIAKARA